MNTFDRHFFFKVLKVMFVMIALLVFIFIIIDFSENSDDFSDRGAVLKDIIFVYYYNYIPEMVRLISPVALFISTLLVTGQMAERMEIVALKAAGVSTYRIYLPLIILSILCAGGISMLDGYVVPNSTAKRVEFEKKYIRKKNNNQMDYTQIYRQESSNSILKINSYEGSRNTGYSVKFYKYNGDTLLYILESRRMEWITEDSLWRFHNSKILEFNDSGYTELDKGDLDTTLNIFPRDLARTSSDIFQLTYPEAKDYIAALERSRADNIDLPKVQLYSRYTYPLACIVVALIGFAISTTRRKSGKGFQLAMGLGVSFIYLTIMKVAEPFGSNGVISPFVAALFPHLFFMIIGIVLIIGAKK